MINKVSLIKKVDVDIIKNENVKSSNGILKY